MASLKKLTFILLLWLPLLCLNGFAAEEYGIFDHYTANDGLISNRVFSLTTDKDGFIWASTDFGLELFDGTRFTHHRKTEYTELSREDFIFAHTLPNGNIAAGGYNGLFVEYDPIRDTFYNVMPKEFNESFYKETLDIYYSPQGDRYAVTSVGVYTYDKEKREYSNDNQLFKITKDIYVRSIYVDAKGRYWLGSIDSLLVKKNDGTTILKYSPKGEACSFVRTILPLNNHKVAVAAQNNEIWLFDENSDSIAAPVVIPTPFSCVTQIIKDRTGRYWFPTDGNGLWFTDQELNETTTFTKLIPYNANIDEANKIYSIIEDKRGEIWFGTQNSGIWRYRKNNASGISTSSDFGFPPAVCTSFVEDDNHNLIVSVDGGGLYSFNPQKKFAKLISLPNNNIANITRLSDGTCYVATWGGGIFRYYPQTNKIEKEKFDGVSNPCNSFFNLNVLNGTDLYACTTGDGLYRKRKGEKLWSHITPYDSATNAYHQWIQFAYADTPTEVWINSTRALWLMKDGKNKIISQDINTFKKLTPLEFFDAKGDGDGYIFAATNKGIKRISANGEIEDLSFVPESLFRILLKDNYGKYWAAGDDGIFSFDYATKTCTKLPGNFTDVATNYFYFRAGYKTTEGKLYFGTNAGFICINPQDLTYETSIEHLAFATLVINNKKVTLSEAPLNGTPISQKSEIELPYGKTDISLTIRIADFAHVDKAQCQYRLVGLQDQWMNVGPDHTIRFSHIPTGKFKLEVKAFRSNETCEEKVISLSINVLPPWWATWWFITLMLLLALLCAILIYNQRVRHLVEMKDKLNNEVAIRTAELQTALKDKDNLISVIGHDLRNPMFAIVVALGNWLNKEQTLSDEKKHHLIEEVYKSAQTLQGEMLKLLNWTRSKQSELVFKPQEIDLEPIINDAVQLSEALLKDKKIDLQKNISLSHKAYADDRMVSAVIRNLLGNAIKYTPSEGNIYIDAWEDDYTIHIAVRDTGIGMPAEIVNKINSNEQQELNSTLGTNQEKGTGLGLNICKKYIKRNNGILLAESKQGEGSCLSITLPVSTSKTSAAQKSAIEATGKNISKEIIAGKTILVVDDNPLFCENMKMLLSDYCNVIIAQNGQEAIKLIEENEIDLILSDVDMPIMNGIELCTELQQDESTACIPFLIVSGRVDESDRLQGLSKGAIDYITKPFNQDELLAKLCSLFQLRAISQNHILTNIMQNRDEKSDEEDTEDTIAAENPFLSQFMELVRQKHSDPELSVDNLADDLCVSRSTMFRRIKAIVGKSPVELLGEYRLNEAMRQLKNNDTLSVNEIAYAVGFSDASYFSKKFKAHFGIKPTQARGGI